MVEMNLIKRITYSMWWCQHINRRYWKIRNMGLKVFSGKLLNWFNAGHFVISKFQIVFYLVVLFAIWKVSWWYYLLAIPVAAFIILVIGYIVVVSGVWDSFIKEQLKGINHGK